KQWDEAIKNYELAALENPGEAVYRLALMRAKASAGLFHVQQARTLAGQGKTEEAVSEVRKALSYDPQNRFYADELAALTREPAKKTEPAAEKGIEAPFKLKVTVEKVQLKFTEAQLRSIFQALGKYAGINFVFDEQFRDVSLSIDLTDRTFEQAMSFLCLASKNFYRPIDEKTVIIVPDQPMKRMQYELNAIKTFYLSNLNAQDVQNSLAMMIRTPYKAPSIIIDKNLNSVTIRDTPNAVNLAEKLLRRWDKSKGEVIIDLEIMEVSRLKMQKLGIDLGQNAVSGRYSGSGTFPTDGWFGLKDIDLSRATNYQLSLPSMFLPFLETDADTKIIAQPRLRGIGSEDIKYMVGQKVPVPQTTFTPFAAGGISQQPIINYNYQDVGIDVKIKPRIHYEKEVTLELEIKITSIGGKGIADIPIITTREVKNVIRLKDGETNLLAGLLKDEERKSLKGIPGLKGVPFLGALFSSTDTTIEQTDVILTITPYIIRSVPLTEEDSKPLWVDIEGLQGQTSEQVFPEEEFSTGEPATEERGGPNAVILNPANFEVPKGREFRVSVDLRSDLEIGNMSLDLSYDPRIIKLKEVSEGGLVRRLGEKVPFLKNIDNSAGACTIGLTSPAVGKGIKGGGILAVLVFESAAPGEASIAITSVSANGPMGQPLQFETNGSRVVVR
ncbi:MAG: cohesin domain-containing protein, partial [Candidatus Aminicenantes bacterium]|nr:cohesin domain-containing protein [Candidatus Aminicenantes bacterium]